MDHTDDPSQDVDPAAVPRKPPTIVRRLPFLIVGAALVVGLVCLIWWRPGGFPSAGVLRRAPEPLVEKPAGPRHRVLRIGWDGATFHMIDPMVAAGRLPNLARMMDEGGPACNSTRRRCYGAGPARGACRTSGGPLSMPG